MKIENLENLQEINTEELSSLEGGIMLRDDMDIMRIKDIVIKDIVIDPHRPMPEEKPEPKPLPEPIKRFPLPRPIHGCYPFPKCFPGHPPFCAIPL